MDSKHGRTAVVGVVTWPEDNRPQLFQAAIVSSLRPEPSPGQTGGQGGHSDGFPSVSPH